MRRSSLALAVLAITGWLGAIVSEVAALRADDEATASRWTLTRNRFLLLSSVSTNTLVFSTLYRYAKALRRGGRQAGSRARVVR